MKELAMDLRLTKDCLDRGFHIRDLKISRISHSKPDKMQLRVPTVLRHMHSLSEKQHWGKHHDFN
jgi:hypothetical protein